MLDLLGRLLALGEPRAGDPFRCRQHSGGLGWRGSEAESIWVDEV
jgi:hypothetical protein